MLACVRWTAAHSYDSREPSLLSPFCLRVSCAGETNFPRNHNLSVHPKKGRAVLWPSVYDHDPHEQDGRSNHQAKPVIRGIKYGANAWIHQRDFKGPNGRGC